MMYTLIKYFLMMTYVETTSNVLEDKENFTFFLGILFELMYCIILL